MTTSDLIQRLTSEADVYAEGSHTALLCTDAADKIIALSADVEALESMMDGSDVSRKALAYDVANHERLINDSAEALNRATREISLLQKEKKLLMDTMSDNDTIFTLYEQDILKLDADNATLKAEKELVLESNAELTRLLTKKRG